MRFYCSYVLLLAVGLSACTYLPEPITLPAGSVVTEDRTTISVTASRAAASTTGLIFYPGALVDPHAYVALMQRLSEAGRGYRVFIAKVPANLAVLQPEAARAIIVNHADIRNWVIAGHSLGGAMACTYVRRNPVSVRGLLLLAAYPTKADDLSGWSGRVTVLYGDQDTVLNRDALTEGLGRLPAGTNVVRMAGGNHAQFGNYGQQQADGQATISRDEQQGQTAHQFVDFMNALGL